MREIEREKLGGLEGQTEKTKLEASKEKEMEREMERTKKH